MMKLPDISKFIAFNWENDSSISVCVCTFHFPMLFNTAPTNLSRCISGSTTQCTLELFGVENKRFIYVSMYKLCKCANENSHYHKKNWKRYEEKLNNIYQIYTRIVVWERKETESLREGTKKQKIYTVYTYIEPLCLCYVAHHFWRFSCRCSWT